jgi:spermidine synthase
MALFILLCFFLSGLTGLVYEILWTRMIVTIIGGAPFAISIVLTIFMGGLGLGSFLAGRTVDRIKEPLRLIWLYGLLELVVAAYCLCLPWLLAGFKPLYGWLYNHLFAHFFVYSLLTFLGCALLLLTPVVCMGATLPILCRFYVTRLSRVGTQSGRLYGLNTVGAAVGALACGFWMIHRLGMQGTLVLAVLINTTIGVSCLWLGRKAKREKSRRPPEDAPVPEPAGPHSHPEVLAALVIFGVSGFCAMAYEVIWTKLLGLIVGPTTYSFTLVLVTFITSLALGSLFFGWLGDKVTRPLSLLLVTQMGAGLFALFVSQILGNSPLFFGKLLYHFQADFALRQGLTAGAIFGFLFVPTLFLGATFPLVGKITTRSTSTVGYSLGRAYAVNTIGAVLGSFSAGFILIPLLGKERSLGLVIAIQILTCLVVAGVTLRKEGRRLWRWIPAALVSLASLSLCWDLPIWNRHLLSHGQYHRFDKSSLDLGEVGWGPSLFQAGALLSAPKHQRVLYYGDGVGGFTTVVSTPDLLGNVDVQMNNSGKPDASTHGDMATQTLLAHLPMLAHPQARQVMVLGLASGVTAGEVLHYPVERVDVLEISQQVVEASHHFNPWNNKVLSDPRTELIIQDARAHLQLTDRSYDVIISEPSNPWMAGLATLFTEEFFTLARDRLGAEGIFTQFIHSYEMDWETFALVGRTFARVFPNSALVTAIPDTFGPDFLLIGFKGSTSLVPEILRRNLPHAKRSPHINLPHTDLLFRLILCERLDLLYAEGPINSDKHPELEFAAPRFMYHTDPTIARHLSENAYLTPRTAELRERMINDIDAQLDFTAYALSVFRPFGHMVDLSRATHGQRQRYSDLVETYSAQTLWDWSLLEDAPLQQTCRLRQIQTLQAQVAGESEQKAEQHVLLADLYAQAGMLEQTVSHYRQALALRPQWRAALNALAWRLAVHEQAPFHNPQEAIRLAELACQLTGRQHLKYLDTLGVAYAAASRFKEAQTAAGQALEIATASGQTDIAEKIRRRLQGYGTNQAYTEPVTPSADR